MEKKSIFWFRQDLRISDNPGLYKAVHNSKCFAVYILDNELLDSFGLGSASSWWLHNSLHKLNEALHGKLNVYCGNSKRILLNLTKCHGINSIYWNYTYEPRGTEQDAKIEKELLNMGVECNAFNAVTLWSPKEVLKSDGSCYKVFTPFYKNGCLSSSEPRKPLDKPHKLNLIKDFNSLAINELKLLPKERYHSKFANYWEVGEIAAQKRLADFIKNGLAGYKENRNFPALKNTSYLSPYLHFGEISPNQVWHAIKAAEENATTKASKTIPSAEDINHFLSELGWREFSYYLLYHFPNLPHRNFQQKFDKFPWKEDKTLLTAWQKGKTGYPIVDAGMRELWQTGYMHNRVRMIVASFLVKNLMQHWHHGAKWFLNCLLDADLASNSVNWQWVAGSGTDAAPYFRIFNPITQGEKFDPNGEYTKKFVPELAKLPNKYLFKPWEAPAHILDIAEVTLGKNYPKPIINLQLSRKLALEAFAALRKK